MKQFGVVGAGVMGRGVAHAMAQSGFQVILVDISPKVLEEAEKEIYRSAQMQILYKKSTAKPEEIIDKIQFTLDYDDLKEVTFLVENTNENVVIKQEVLKKLVKVCKKDCKFAINTSCISITQIAAKTDNPKRVIGIHFMNPVLMKNTVEVIKGYHTSDETVATTNEFLASIGKKGIIVNDLPGFVSNRISHLYMNEAAFVIQDHIATPEQVDEIFRDCFGHKMGPLETADLIGLDTVVDSLEVLYESYHDSKFRTCPLLKKMVDAGALGKKSGQGFYDYAI